MWAVRRLPVIRNGLFGGQLGVATIMTIASLSQWFGQHADGVPPHD